MGTYLLCRCNGSVEGPIGHGFHGRYDHELEEDSRLGADARCRWTGLGLSILAGPAAAATDSNLPRVLQPKIESIQPKHEHPQYPTSASCPICKDNGVWKRQV